MLVSVDALAEWLVAADLGDSHGLEWPVDAVAELLAAVEDVASNLGDSRGLD